ncbi:unnamed protein product [Rotaria socialis]|uniref:Heat shock factor-binding protein 1 n=1 Tax=Rotaria socialis TaxID=392032 RepID=A0A820G492_9BILA|nr:unnamed protein product [Rotaria socialis]CAF3384510.1 unnamed protein product [Rotaria socialis]CAF3391875.1 unnamed protein product [Rotaria socialis]CAF3446633.1 unnamed protein product [Rotaria socialis]CAF3588734.1 unnamed protein product [Rotaria socialis]
MTDTRTLSSSSSSITNHVNGTNTVSSAPSDVNNVNGLTEYVNTIFRQMEEKFHTASDQVMNRMNELGRKIDTLESSLGDIISHIPSEESATTGSPQSVTATTAQQ